MIMVPTATFPSDPETNKKLFSSDIPRSFGDLQNPLRKTFLINATNTGIFMVDILMEILGKWKMDKFDGCSEKFLESVGENRRR